MNKQQNKESDIKVIVKGIPVSSGKALNKPALIVSSTAEFQKVLDAQDVILIVKNFDPAYDVLLPHCSGVISEIGTLLCHLAIVARMRKIPAVVNAPNVTSLLKDGDIVSLDADKGILYKTSEDKG